MVLFINCFVILFLAAYFLGMLSLNFSAIKDNKIEKKPKMLEVTSAEYSLAVLHTDKQQVAQVRTAFSWVPTIKKKKKTYYFLDKKELYHFAFQ